MRAEGAMQRAGSRDVAIQEDEATLRRAVYEACRTHLQASLQAKKQSGKVPFEGGWVTPAQARLVYQDLLRRQRRVFWELILLLGALGCCGLVGWALTYLLCCA